MYNYATIGDLMALTSVQNNRNSNRLRGYDYTLAGAYFVTIVTYQHQCLFGEIINGEITLNSLGLIAYEQWQRLGKRFTKADFSTFVSMPNHVHGIIQLWGAGGNDQDLRDEISPCAPTRGHMLSLVHWVQSYVHI